MTAQPPPAKEFSIQTRDLNLWYGTFQEIGRAHV